MDDNVATGFCVSATDARFFFKFIIISHWNIQFAGIGCLAIDMERVPGSYMDDVGLYLSAVAEDKMVYTIADQVDVVVLDIALDDIESGLNSDVIAAGQRGVTAACSILISALTVWLASSHERSM